MESGRIAKTGYVASASRTGDTMNRKGSVWWEVLAHVVIDAIILFLVIGAFFFVYRSCTTKEITQEQMDGQRILRDIEALRPDESVFVPLIGMEYSVVLHPIDGQLKPGTCRDDACLCIYPKGSSDASYCGTLPAVVKNCDDGPCIEGFQRVEVGDDRVVTIRRKNNRLVIEKAPKI